MDSYYSNHCICYFVLFLSRWSCKTTTLCWRCHTSTSFLMLFWFTRMTLCTKSAAGWWTSSTSPSVTLIRWLLTSWPVYFSPLIPLIHPAITAQTPSVQMTRSSPPISDSHQSWHSLTNVYLLSAGELLTSLVCHPEYKLLSLCNIPQMSSTSLAYSVFNWPGLLKHLRQMLIASARMEEGECCDIFLKLHIWKEIQNITSLIVCRIFLWNLTLFLKGIDWTVSAPLAVTSAGESATNSRHKSFNLSLANLLILRGKDVSTAVTGTFIH